MSKLKISRVIFGIHQWFDFKRPFLTFVLELLNRDSEHSARKSADPFLQV